MPEQGDEGEGWARGRRRKAIPPPRSLADRCICQSVADVSGSFYVVTRPVVIIAHFYLATVTVHRLQNSYVTKLWLEIIGEFIARDLHWRATVNQRLPNFQPLYYAFHFLSSPLFPFSVARVRARAGVTSRFFFSFSCAMPGDFSFGEDNLRRGFICNLSGLKLEEFSFGRRAASEEVCFVGSWGFEC